MLTECIRVNSETLTLSLNDSNRKLIDSQISASNDVIAHVIDSMLAVKFPPTL